MGYVKVVWEFGVSDKRNRLEMELSGTEHWDSMCEALHSILSAAKNFLKKGSWA